MKLKHPARGGTKKKSSHRGYVHSITGKNNLCCSVLKMLEGYGTLGKMLKIFSRRFSSVQRKTNTKSKVITKKKLPYNLKRETTSKLLSS